MPDVASVLKEEISRLARKEIRQSVDPFKKQVVELRRRLRDAERTIARLQRSTKKAVAAVSDQTGVFVPDPDSEGEGQKVRISAESVRKHRERLRLTQAEMAALIGVTPFTIHRWEKGLASPRGASREAFSALRKLGVREVRSKLDGAADGAG